jgi:hypothetical protein
MNSAVFRGSVLCMALAVLHALVPSAPAKILPTADGFHGIWYAVGPSKEQYAYKYSGGLGTYTHQTSPLAIYAPQVDRTFFVYGGTDGTSNSLRNYISYYDHNTGRLARPREVRRVGGHDNHQNITLTIDDSGYLHVFGNSHGNGGTGNHYKSAQPFSIAEFDELQLPADIFNNHAPKPKIVLAYSNPFYLSKHELLLVYNQYDDGRAVHVATSPDGLHWADQSLIDTDQGHYSVARQNGNTIGVMADFHRGGSLDHRTNLYYLQTTDFAKTWTNAAGASLSPPLKTRNNSALVHDYFAENQLVYMKDVDYDAAGNPILFYLTVSDADGKGHLSGPHPGGRALHTARWTGDEWQIRNMLSTDHNYDHGELCIEPDGSWRITGTFIAGPQKYGTGGEIGVWTSHNQGGSWKLLQQLTNHSKFNHAYVRHPVNAQDDFYAYWADGNAFAESTSRLYFATKSGNVYRMPTRITGDSAAPEPLAPVLERAPDLRDKASTTRGKAN